MPSILSPHLLAAGSTAAANPEGAESGLALGVAVLAGLASVGLAWVLGLLRPARLSAVRRVPGRGPMAPLVGVMFAGVVVWAVGPTLFLRPGPVNPGQPVTATGPDVRPPSTRDLVVINATIPVVAFIVLAVGDALVRPRVGQRLGVGLGRVPRGAAGGLAGILLALPLVYAAMRLSEVFYRQVGYQHPSEHDLLRAMGDAADPFVKYLAVAAAVVVAPLWEELLFRGHVQTLIREGLIRMRDGLLRADLGADGLPDRPGQVLQDAGRRGDAPEADVDERPRAVESWMAIVLTSVLFAGVHQPWTWPPIFVLSVCLGLAYERTSNVWVPMVMHASFNGLMTALFLLGRAVD